MRAFLGQGGAVIEGESSPSLEKALAKTQTDADAVLRAAAAATTAVKRLRAASQVGN